jgi:hypothetical protein
LDEHKHQRLGKRWSLELTAKILRSNLLSQDLGKESTFIQGSAMKTKLGLFFIMSLFSANLEGELANPLMFQ